MSVQQTLSETPHWSIQSVCEETYSSLECLQNQKCLKYTSNCCWHKQHELIGVLLFIDKVKFLHLHLFLLFFFEEERIFSPDLKWSLSVLGHSISRGHSLMHKWALKQQVEIGEYVTILQSPRMSGWVRLEGSSGSHLVQPLCSRRFVPLEHITQDYFQMVI